MSSRLSIVRVPELYVKILGSDGTSGQRSKLEFPKVTLAQVVNVSIWSCFSVLRLLLNLLNSTLQKLYTDL